MRLLKDTMEAYFCFLHTLFLTATSNTTSIWNLHLRSFNGCFSWMFFKRNKEVKKKINQVIK